jgi:protein involved in polysaccharide export with SLBB domain
VVLPQDGTEATEPVPIEPEMDHADGHPPWFGSEFFRLDSGVFLPPSFGPVPEDYRLGVGDELIVDVWGDAEFRLERIVDRDGAVILPRAGRVVCAGRTLADVDRTVREQLARHHASIGSSLDDAAASTWLRVTLGRLRPIRVFVVGAVARPGSYELNSVSTILTALYAAGGPAEGGSLRHVRLVRNGETAAELDLYVYLLGGDRSGDARLREGDTVFLPDRELGVEVTGAVRRPQRYEMTPAEDLGDLIRYAGGFAATASPAVVHLRRILPPAARRPGEPDIVQIDVPFDADAMRPRQPESGRLLDGDVVTVAGIDTTLGEWVRIEGRVKRPGTYQMRPGLDLTDLVESAHGLWPDALTEWVVIDRTSARREFSTLTVPLGDVLAGAAEPVPLLAQDVVRVFPRWETRDRPLVHISGEVHHPLSVEFRQGMTLRDLVLRSGGLKQGANPLRAEISRMRMSAVADPDTSRQPTQTVDVLQVELGEDFLMRTDTVELAPRDRVAVRRLPWWESQYTVNVAGEVFYPGEFSLERRDETLSAVLRRAGGLKPTAYPTGARVVRSKDEVGNIAIDLERALAEPGSQYDIILEPGDRIIVPNRMYTVRVLGEVGFPTSLVHEAGQDIDYYVRRAGGYLENADKKRTRVVHPNGLSLPNKGESPVVAGSTIVVPLKPPPEGPGKMETARDITAILAGVATIWLVIDATTR